MANQINSPHYKQAPLPFVGQKRMFLNVFRQVLNDNIPNDGEGWTIVDVFGGSGLLSHQAKKIKPKARVIFNDFDDFLYRVKIIPETNRLRRKLFTVLNHLKEKEKLSPVDKENVFKILRQFDGEIDFITIQRWLLYSGKYAKDWQAFKEMSFFNGVNKTTICPLMIISRA